MPVIKCFTHKVHQTLLTLVNNKANGWDGIPAVVLNLLLFSPSFLNSPTVPVFTQTSWKHTYVCPIPKKGDMSDPSN